MTKTIAFKIQFIGEGMPEESMSQYANHTTIAMISNVTKRVNISMA